MLVSGCSPRFATVAEALQQRREGAFKFANVFRVRCPVLDSCAQQRGEPTQTLQSSSIKRLWAAFASPPLRSVERATLLRVARTFLRDR